MPTVYMPSADPKLVLGRGLIGLIQLPAYVASKPKVGIDSGPAPAFPTKSPALLGELVIAVSCLLPLAVCGVVSPSGTPWSVAVLVNASLFGVPGSIFAVTVYAVVPLAPLAQPAGSEPAV